MRWRPLTEYIEAPYAGYDPIVLLGWGDYKDSSGRDGTEGMRFFGVGWLSPHDKRWHDSIDGRAWPNQPTHFACVCQDIEQP